MISQQRRATLLVAPAIALLGMFALWPGLDGIFLLDDRPNLEGLQMLSLFPTLAEFWNFVFSGIAGPLGRPISLFTFALQHESWPGDPFAFKIVNLGLHIINALMLFAWVRLLGRLRFGEQWRPALALATLAALLWLLHPIHASSIFYVVQRMTLLAGSFTLAGLWMYTAGRLDLARGSTRRGYVLCTLAATVMVLAAGLSKENGLLLLPMLIVLEWTLLSDLSAPTGWRRWQAIFFLLPVVLAAIGILLLHERLILLPYEARDFTLLERILSQPRILLGHVQTIVMPVASAFGVYHDDFRASSGILEPWTTLPALLGWAAAVILAIIHRRRYPWPSFAVLFFVAGHLMESTVFPLELVFEHRNYVPSAGILLVVALVIVELWRRASDAPVRVAFAGLAAVYLALVAFIGVREAMLWGNPVEQAFVWARENPDSYRARVRPAIVWMNRGEHAKAVPVLEQLEADFPGIPNSIFLRANAACHVPAIDGPHPAAMLEAARSAKMNAGVLFSLESIVASKLEGRCPEYSLPHLHRLIVEMVPVMRYNGMKGQLLYQQARLERAVGEFDRMADSLARAWEFDPRPNFLLIRAAWLAQAGRLEQADATLERLETSALSAGIKARIALIRKQIERTRNGEE